jgi:hypothetical protein
MTLGESARANPRIRLKARNFDRLGLEMSAYASGRRVCDLSKIDSMLHQISVYVEDLELWDYYFSD